MFEEFEDGLIKKPSIDNTKELIPQGTIDWFIQRLGVFTGSRIPDLMSNGRTKGTIGAKAISYINEKAVERMLNEDGKLDYIARNTRGSAATSWGIDNESWARSLFTELTGLEVEETEFIFHKELDYFGGSSDGKVIGENSIIEIKNPYDPVKHMNNMLMCKSGVYPKNGDYYGQMQANIEIAKADGCYFISGDKRSNIPLAWVYVKRDDDYIKAMIERLSIAEEMVINILNNFEK